MKAKVRIETSKYFEKQLSRVPKFIRIKVMLWVLMVEQEGLEEMRKHKGFHDEPLLGKRSGQRSVRMNKAYRLIYIEKMTSVSLLLIEVSKHDY